MLRFAPLPTGDMPIETLRVAILNYLVAQHANERFIVRIEDSEISEEMEGKDTEIMQILEKFALKHDAVSHQSENLHIYQTLAIKLLEEEKAFICTCSGEEKAFICTCSGEEIAEAQDREAIDKTANRYSGKCLHRSKQELATLKELGTPFVIRVKEPAGAIILHDLLKGDLTYDAEEIDAFVLLNENGQPTLDFAAACADMLSGVDHLIVEEKDLLSTFKQSYVKTLLGYDQEIRFVHLPALENPGGETTVKSLLEEGFIPDAIINYLISIGNANTPKEIFTLPDAVTWFKIENISSSPAPFDREKLCAINRAHLDRMDDKQLSSLFGFADADIGKLAKLYLDEQCTTKELKEKIDTIFSPKDFVNPWGEKMRVLEKVIMDAPMIDSYTEFETYLLKESSLDTNELETPLRLLLTGSLNGPGPAQLYPYIKSYILEVAS